MKKKQIILDAIELKNGMILAITYNNILNIKVNDNKDEICNLSKIPFKSERKILSIYELPKNNILISSILLAERKPFRRGCFEYYEDTYNNIEVVFNLEKYKIIKTLKNDRLTLKTYYYEYKIIIYNKYICVLKNCNIYIYNISNYDFIKGMEILFGL